MRGIAALVVVAHHCALAFNEPAIASHDPAQAWSTGPWFLAVNGLGAVVFFFVLSGFVLSLGPLRRNDHRAVLQSAIKRWPRLAGPVLLTVLFSWLLWTTNVFTHTEAASVTHSGWLHNFASAFPNALGFQPDLSLAHAIQQGLWGTFLTGDMSFDSSLWTMKYEFYGSFAVFALLAVLISIKRTGWQIAALIAVGPAFFSVHLFYFAFWCGVALAFTYTRAKTFQLPPWAAVLLGCGGLYALGFRYPIGAYAFLDRSPPILIETLGATSLLTGMLACPALGHPLRGHIGRLLGRYSFPIYLVHVLLLMSVGTTLFLLLYQSSYEVAVAVAIIGTIVSTMAIAYCLAAFESWWLPLLNKATGTLVRALVAQRPRAEAMPQA
jgi:peptidoglycan/LPS O-acetylase OafA/YrhL